jgi:hypothetical protein
MDQAVVVFRVVFGSSLTEFYEKWTFYESSSGQQRSAKRRFEEGQSDLVLYAFVLVGRRLILCWRIIGTGTDGERST